MASFERLKGHDPVLDAWPEVRKSIPVANLLIVGSGDDQARLRRRTAREQIAGVEFLRRFVVAGLNEQEHRVNCRHPAPRSVAQRLVQVD